MGPVSAAVSPSFSVAGYHVLITGGSGGIGAALARAFAAHGAAVTLADLKPPPADCGGMHYAQLDVRDDAAIAALAARTSRLDVLIHCAGFLAQGGEEFRVEIFRAVVDVHLNANIALANAFKPHLAARKGSLINIASMYSYFGSPRIPAYGAAKAAVIQLTKTLAIAWAPDGVRVNAIAPGWVRTELSRGAMEDEVFNRKVVDRIPVGRWAEPEEIAGAAIFLASPAASMVTGITLPVDGGYSAV
jgi:NAD(P)-dependent dehydrogenase (short-subunit alcohol dehydrogenase family)